MAKTRLSHAVIRAQPGERHVPPWAGGRGEDNDGEPVTGRKRHLQGGLPEHFRPVFTGHPLAQSASHPPSHGPGRTSQGPWHLCAPK